MRPTSTLVPPICAVEVLFVVSIDTAVTVPVCVLPSVAVYDTSRPTSAPAASERCSATSWVFWVAICCSDWVWVSVAAAGLAGAAAVGGLLLGRLLLRGLLLGLGGPRPAGVAVDVEPRAADPGRLQVAAQVGQRREQRLPAGGVRAAQVEGDHAL